MLHKITGATIVVALILLLLLKFEVLGGTVVIIGVVAMFAASCVLTVVSLLSGRKASSPQPKPAQPNGTSSPAQPTDGASESPMQVACRYMRTGDALKAEGRFDEAIATYREGEDLARQDPKLGPDHGMTFLLGCAARDLERVTGKKRARRQS